MKFCENDANLDGFFLLRVLYSLLHTISMRREKTSRAMTASNDLGNYRGLASVSRQAGYECFFSFQVEAADDG